MRSPFVDDIRQSFSGNTLRKSDSRVAAGSLAVQLMLQRALRAPTEAHGQLCGNQKAVRV